MEEQKNKKVRRKKAPRQSWKPHWTLSLLKTIWSVAFGALKIAIGAAATVALICAICGLVFVTLLGDYLQEDIASLAGVELPATDQNSFVLYVIYVYVLFY